MAKTESCQAAHLQFHVSGVMRVRINDGTELECKAGDVSLLPSGHDAWVVGDEPVVVIDFQGMVDYAKLCALLTADTRARHSRLDCRRENSICLLEMPG